jgi:regulator of protease activity HflC (stomatin/prohibitin superfamily)
MNRSTRAAALAIAAIVVVACLAGVHWTWNRIYVDEGHSLMLRYKGPLLMQWTRVDAQPGQFAQPGQVGVLEQLRGPGRHFYCPLWWERKVVPDQVVQPGQIAIVTSKLGDVLPAGQFLVEGDISGPTRAQHKGILRKVYGPGRYRVNPYAFEFNIINTNVESDGQQRKHSGWVEIPAGYVGVVTNLADNPAAGKVSGIQDEVLPPGLYPVNPREQQIDIVEIGYRESSITVEQEMSGGQVVHDESGEPVAQPDSGIGFPSNDGFDIQLDFTAIWGVMPNEAPRVVGTFGNIEQAEQKVILPQSESICRNNGSKMSAVELLVGESRQQFQVNTSEAFQQVLKDKNLTLMYGLVRHIYIPQEVRIPIQKGYIADELKLTRQQERITTMTEADLREAEKKVELEAERVRVETDKLVANAIAEGEKEAKEIDAETNRLVAEIERQIAALEAQRKVVLGEAESTANRLANEATSQKFQLAVAAFGTAEAYNKWQFAEGLPPSIDLRLLYAGEGTLWTDLQGVMPTIPLKDPPAAAGP